MLSKDQRSYFFLQSRCLFSLAHKFCEQNPFHLLIFAFFWLRAESSFFFLVHFILAYDHISKQFYFFSSMYAFQMHRFAHYSIILCLAIFFLFFDGLISFCILWFMGWLKAILFHRFHTISFNFILACLGFVPSSEH